MRNLGQSQHETHSLTSLADLQRGSCMILTVRVTYEAPEMSSLQCVTEEPSISIRGDAERMSDDGPETTTGVSSRASSPAETCQQNDYAESARTRQMHGVHIIHF
jgi:hypothetical protein